MRVTRSPIRVRPSRLKGKAFPCYEIPLQAGMSIGMLLVSVELLIHAVILLFVPGTWPERASSVRHRRIAGAGALRVAGGIFTKIADIGSDLLKIVFKIKEDDARNPGVIAELHGRQRGRFGGPRPTVETYGVTGVA